MRGGRGQRGWGGGKKGCLGSGRGPRRRARRRARIVRGAGNDALMASLEAAEAAERALGMALAEAAASAASNLILPMLPRGKNGRAERAEEGSRSDSSPHQKEELADGSRGGAGQFERARKQTEEDSPCNSAEAKGEVPQPQCECTRDSPREGSERGGAPSDTPGGRCHGLARRGAGRQPGLNARGREGEGEGQGSQCRRRAQAQSRWRVRQTERHLGVVGGRGTVARGQHAHIVVVHLVRARVRDGGEVAQSAMEPGTRGGGGMNEPLREAPRRGRAEKGPHFVVARQRRRDGERPMAR